ncbi:8656_t:CDS:2 [Cetraspora pellucida]|uniref:8656_t:CDS:1 n=1 Tax=Cetraspora pellucida TaxID=1433469 RepID=A0ACA9KC66_9GLOM|nr:8656_t:CDS:2 [Cetraspora pellucida]
MEIKKNNNGDNLISDSFKLNLQTKIIAKFYENILLPKTFIQKNLTNTNQGS